MDNYQDNQIAAIWLSMHYNMSAKKRMEILAHFDDAKALYDSFISDKDYIIELIGENNYTKLSIEHPIETIRANIKAHNDKGISIVTYYCDNYPQQFKDYDDPPICLYCLGDVSLMDTKFSIAVVGTRKPTRYGKDVTKMLVTELSHYHFNIVSGLARGVDTIAHRAALENNTTTVAVMAGGLNKIYPSENTELAREIIRNGGLVVTEYPMGVEPVSYNFPNRNRIISGIAENVLITEAGLKSGTMITADTALCQSKSVFAVPGSILSEESAGANLLIKDGAIPVCDINDILDVYNIRERVVKPSTIQLDFIEQAIVDELKEDCHFDGLLIKSKLTVDKLMPILLKLELCGVVKKLPGNLYAKVIR